MPRRKKNTSPSAASEVAPTMGINRVEAIIFSAGIVLFLFLMYTIREVASPFVVLGAILFLLYPLRANVMARNIMWLSVALFSLVRLFDHRRACAVRCRNALCVHPSSFGDEGRVVANSALATSIVIIFCGIEVRQRLVEEKDARLAHDGPPHGHALPLAAGHLAGAAIEQLLDAQQARRLVHRLAPRRRLHAAHLEGKLEDLPRRHLRVEGVALEDHRDVAVLRRHPRHRLARDDDVARVGLLEPRHQAQRGRLAAAARPHDDEELAARDRQRDRLERCRRGLARARREALAHPVEEDFDLGHRSISRGGRGSFRRGLGPPLRGARQVLLRVDLHVAAVRVDAVEGRAALEHLLEEIDEVRLLEGAPLAPRLAGPLRLRLVEPGEQLAGAVGAEPGHADELAAGLVAVDACATARRCGRPRRASSRRRSRGAGCGRCSGGASRCR